MLIGHYGIAFALKKYDKSLNLGFLFIAAMLIDFVFSFLILLGIEHMRIAPGFTEANSLDLYDVPFSHSLLGAVILTISTFILVRYLFLKNSDKTNAEKTRTALILGITVMSHFVLDLLVHVPDLLLIPGIDVKVGLGLWNYLVLSVILELSVLLIGVILYFKSTTSKFILSENYKMLMFVSFLTFFTIMTPFLVPPSVIAAVMSTLLINILITLVVFWLERKKEIINKIEE